MTRARIPVLVTAFVAAGCAAAAPPPAAEPAPEEKAQEPVSEGPRAAVLPALTTDEASAVTDLTEELALLAEFGDRSGGTWDLAGATDHVAARFAAYGYEPVRRGFTWGEVVVQNVEAEAPGLQRGNQLVVVGARLDANPGSPGADDNLSGVATLLVLAKRAAQKRALRTLRFVVFSSAGSRVERQAQGARHYAELLEQGEHEVTAVIELHGLGVYSEALNSQNFPDSVLPSSSIGDFMVLVSQPEAAAIAEQVNDALREHSSLPTRHWVLLRDDAFLQGSGALEFVENGFPALLLTDTRGLRYPDFGTARDVAANLDVPRMARAVSALGPALLVLTGPHGEAPLEEHQGLEPGP